MSLTGLAKSLPESAQLDWLARNGAARASQFVAPQPDGPATAPNFNDVAFLLHPHKEPRA